MADLTEIREALARATPGQWRAGVLAPCIERDDARARAEKAEAAVERVRRLATLALYKGPEPADTHAVVLDSLAKELIAALDGE